MFQIWYLRKWIITSIVQNLYMQVTRFKSLWVSGFIPLSNLRLKSQRKKSHSLTRTCTKGRGVYYKESLLDVWTHYKLTETFLYTNFYLCHLPRVTKGFIKGEALRLLRTNPFKPTFEANIKDYLCLTWYLEDIQLAWLKQLGDWDQFTDRHSALTQKNQTARKKILPFVTQYCPALPGLKNILREKWHLIQNHPRSKEIFKEPPLIVQKREISQKHSS